MPAVEETFPILDCGSGESRFAVSALGASTTATHEWFPGRAGGEHENSDYGVFEGSARDRVVMDEYRRLGCWAPELVELMVQRLFAGGSGTLIDIVGVPVIERARAQGVCFEPEPQNSCSGTWLAGSNAAHPVPPCGPHAARGQTMPLLLSQDNLGDHRLQHAAASDAPGRSLLVPTARLDDVLRDQALRRRWWRSGCAGSRWRCSRVQ